MAMRSEQPKSLIVRPGQHLVAVPYEEDGAEVIRYFVEDESTEVPLSEEQVAKIRSLFGVWSDLDGDEMLEALERIRHESKPTPPIDDL